MARGRGSRGRGGQGRGNKGGRGQGDKFQVHQKKTLEEHYFYVGSSKMASDYERTADFIINHIKITFDRGNNIAETLRTSKTYDSKQWKPVLQTSTITDADKKATEVEQFKMEYKAELDEYMKRKRIYEDNLYKAYALIWERCAKAMQNKIEARNDYKRLIYNNPIELMKAIKQHARNYKDTRYKMSIITDALRAVLNTKQKEHEGLQDYMRRHKTLSDILESQMGEPIKLTNLVEDMDEYDIKNPSKVQELYKQAHEQLLTYICLENSDPEKYGSILRNLNAQKSLGNDQFPKTRINLNNVLSEHRFDK